MIRHAIPIFTLIMLAAGCQAKSPPASFVRAEQDPTKFEKYSSPPPQRKIEEKVLSLLSEGRQSEAEDLLSDQVDAVPEIAQLIAFNNEDKQPEALALVNRHAEAYRANQRLIFLHAACTRSRFDIEEAYPYFVVAIMANGKTAIGRSACVVAALDGTEQGRTNPAPMLAELEHIVSLYPDEIVVRWMIAVECRSFNRNEQGVGHYKKIIEKWKPGPVLVHQTYGNLLDELKRYDEALVERRKAVELEPAGWSYDGLGNTLDSLGRFDEAEKAHAKACDLDPTDGHHLGNWATNTMLRKKYDEAIKKCELAIQFDPTYPHTWFVWAECLEAQGKKLEALNKYREISKRFPKIADARKNVERLEKILSKDSKEKKS